MGEPVTISILGGSLGWTRNILWNILSARLRLTSGSAWEGNILRRGWRLGVRLGLNGSNMARVDCTRRLPLERVVQQFRIFRRRVWITSVSDQPDFYGSEFVWMRSTLWNDQNLFMTTLKIRISPKNTSVFWRTGLWYQLLVGETTGGGFETLGGDKTHCFISRNKKLTILKSLQYTPSLFLLCFSLLSPHIIA